MVQDKTDFLPPGEPARSLRVSIVEGSFAAVHISVSSSSLVTAYALMLGANDFHLGLLSALGAAGTLGSLAGAWAAGLIGDRRKLVVAAAVGGRSLWAFLCALPFLHVLPGWRLPAFFLTVLASNLLTNAANNGWLSWMTDLVPLEMRGRYFGRRNTILGTASMAVAYAAGKAFDWFKARDMQPHGFAVIFGFAVVCAVVSGAILTRQWDPAVRHHRPLPLRRLVSTPFADRGFRPLLTFTILWAVATAVASPFFSAHMIKNLDMPFSVIAVYSIIAGAMNLLTQPLWGRVIDRLGNKPVLVFNMLGILFLPLFWLFATPSFLLPIWLDSFLTGIFWPGFGLAIFNLILLMAPEKNRTAYLAMQNMSAGLAIFAASMAGGIAAKSLSGLRLSVFGLNLVNFHLLFALTAVLRLSLLPLALRLREERAQSVGAMLNVMGDKASQRFNEYLQAGAMVVRRFGRR